jgi:hypothetical protein
MHERFWGGGGNQKERIHLEVLSTDGRIIFKSSLKNQTLYCGLDRSDTGQGQMAGYCNFGFYKMWEIF